MARTGALLAAGALGAAGLLGIATIGLPLLLAAALLVTALARRGLSDREVAVVFAGAAATFVAFGIASLPYAPCRPGETLSDPPVPGGRSSCGGTHPAIFLVPAAVMLLGAAAAWVHARGPSPSVR